MSDGKGASAAMATNTRTKTTASTGKKKQKQIDFIVTTSDPNSASNLANKKRVRSVAALKSWPERRKKIFEQLENAGGGRGAFVLDDQGVARRKSKTPPQHDAQSSAAQQVSPPSTGSVAKRPKFFGPPLPDSAAAANATYAFNPDAPTFVPIATSTAGDISTQLDTALESNAGSKPGQSLQTTYQNYFTSLLPLPARGFGTVTTFAAVPTTVADVSTRRKRMADGSEKPTETVSDMTLITPPASPQADPSAGVIDPFYNCPVTYKPLFNQILHHMIHVYAPRGWPALKITAPQGKNWEWFMTQKSLEEPALFYVRLLFGSGDMIRLGLLSAEIRYWLRSEAIKAINEALGDPVKCCSDALILAVGRIALHELMYGDRGGSSSVHRRAQRRMIDMRGGMAKLPFPELVKRLMRWSDRLMAVGTGTPRLLEDDGPNTNFTLKESVGAIEGWAPHEIPGVRSKIKISDLVNDDDET
ncbi:hypothetical protein CB0940_03327 [Cercospora beticola]|uniref:Uncharacterized protein n=1 Tax=Cercospora beticola TaxID=122368 RepID=A0A2G5I5L9_CERBT|nr:hypothetical protein CB0940_03327 [Cercospora beticola]PIB00107.1 hypothetical protein CB0940_03327 [Cercospora beticola]WPB00502.1 hypothetical protein RHO25_005122 [Cercospora beticola]